MIEQPGLASLLVRTTHLRGDSCRSSSLLLALRSGERLRALRAGDLVLDGEWLCLEALSEALVDGW